MCIEGLGRHDLPDLRVDNNNVQPSMMIVLILLNCNRNIIDGDSGEVPALKSGRRRLDQDDLVLLNFGHQQLLWCLLKIFLASLLFSFSDFGIEPQRLPAA